MKTLTHPRTQAEQKVQFSQQPAGQGRRHCGGLSKLHKFVKNQPHKCVHLSSTTITALRRYVETLKMQNNDY